MKLHRDIRTFTNAIAKAGDDKSAEAATKDLKDSLNELFDERMTYREKEIEGLEKTSERAAQKARRTETAQE